MRVARIFFSAALGLLLVGCADKTQVNRSAATTTTTTARLDGAVAGYVALPKNGAFGNRRYETSGQMTRDILAASFGRHLVTVETAGRIETIKESLASAKDSGAAYLIYPQILHWEDRATEWSLISDKMEVKVSVFDVASGKVLESAVLSGKSGLATIGGTTRRTCCRNRRRPLRDRCSNEDRSTEGDRPPVSLSRGLSPQGPWHPTRNPARCHHSFRRHCEPVSIGAAIQKNERGRGIWGLKSGV